MDRLATTRRTLGLVPQARHVYGVAPSCAGSGNVTPLDVLADTGPPKEDGNFTDWVFENYNVTRKFRRVMEDWH